MDGYVKHKREEISSLRKTILYAYATTIWILILIPIWHIAMFSNQRPEDWTRTEIVFSHISEESIGFRRTRQHVLNTQNSEQFIIKYVPVDILKENMIAGQVYSLVYSDAAAGGNEMEALFNQNKVFWKLEDSVTLWEQNQRKYLIAIIITICLEFVALILIDRLWCKKAHNQIKKLKADIARREAHISKQ